MKQQLFTIFLLIFLLGNQYNSFSQPGCYKKYWERGELARKNSDWGQAVKHYEAAKRCDTLSRTTLEEIQRLIDLCYSSWASQLEAAKKMIEEQKYYVGFVAETMADENVQRGDFNKAFSLLNITEKQSPGPDYRKDLLPYLSDTIFFNAVMVELFTHENMAIAAVLQKKEQPTKKPSGRDAEADLLFERDSDTEEDTTFKGGFFRLSFYNISGTSLKRINPGIDDIKTLSSTSPLTITKEGNNIILVTDCKIYPFVLEKLSVIPGKVIEYNTLPAKPRQGRSPYDLYTKIKRVCSSLLDSGIYATFSNGRYDSLETRMMYTLSIDNRRTGTINTVDSVYNFDYYPEFNKIAVQKYQTPKSYQFLLLNCNNTDQSVVMNNISGLEFRSDGRITVYQSSPDTAKAGSLSSPDLFSTKPKPKIYYELKQQKWVKRPSYYYHDSLNSYVTQTKQGYNLFSGSSRLNVYDSLFNPVTSYRMSQYVYSSVHDLLFIVNRKIYDASRSQPAEDTLKIIGPARSDSMLLFGSSISLPMFDSIVAIYTKSGLNLLAYGANYAVPTSTGYTFQMLQFPGKKLVSYRNAGMRGYYLLYALNEDAGKYSDTLTLIYSEKKKAVVLEIPGKAETIDLGGEYASSGIGLYIPRPKNNTQTLHIFNTTTQQLISFNLTTERLNDAYLAAYYHNKNLLVVAYEANDGFFEMEYEETGELLSDKKSYLASLKYPTSEIQIHNLVTRDIETIYTRLDVYDHELQVLGNFLVIRGSEEDANYYVTGNNRNNFSYFYNLHLFGDARRDFYTRKYSKGSTKDLLIPVRKKSLTD